MAPLPGRVYLQVVGYILRGGLCGYNLRGGFCLFCASRDGNSSIDTHNPNSFNDPPNVFTHPPQPQYESYSCKLCGNDAHYGYDCPPRVPVVYEHEPGYDNYYPQNSLSFPQQYLNCEKCGGPQEYYQCQPWHQNYSELNPCYDSNSYGFNQPPQNSINHQPLNEINFQDTIREIKTTMHEFLSDNMFKDCQPKNDEISHETYILEPSRRFNSIYYDDDDDEENTIPLNEITSQIPSSIAITPVLQTMEPEDSLIMGDEDLSTISEKESDEFIKSSVEDLVPIPSESEDTSDNDSECDLPFCDNSVTFSNPLFDSNNDFTSSDDESLLEEDVPEDYFKIYANPLFDYDDEDISSDVNPLFNEVLEDIENKDSYVSNLDEPALLVTPLSKLNEDECFDPGGDEIEACLTSDSIPPGIDGADFDPGGDILLLEKLLNDDPSSLLPLKELNFEELKVIKSSVSTDFKDDYYDSKGDIIYLESLLIKDTSIIFLPRIFLPFLTYTVNSLLLLSSGSEDTIFNPGIPVFSFYSLEPVDCPDYEDSRAHGYSQNSKAYIILNKHTRKVEESLNVTFDETPPPSKTSPLVDDDLDEEEAIKVTDKKNLEKDIEDETLEIDEIVNIKESMNHPLENVLENLNQRTLRSQAQNQSNFFCFISTIEPKNVNEALTDDSWIVAMQE
ncbi:hypothetical protein Tco_1068348 [Tanacetum coccineum]|uniref:Retroviral polymerase SH3-like domain-containing protein n=1 Tax=Tanacetum coccineum TaxID=301880 RepID=A0ABQ5HFN1_9ASTR